MAADPTSPGTSELRVIPNDLKTPYTDQFSVGVRQRIGALRTSFTYNFIRGKNQVGYAPLNRSVATNRDGFLDFIPLTNGFSNAVAAFNTRATKYHGVYITVDKPYTVASGWGGGIAYTGVIRSKGRGRSTRSSTFRSRRSCGRARTFSAAARTSFARPFLPFPRDSGSGSAAASRRPS